MTLKEEKCNPSGWNKLDVAFSLPYSNTVNVYFNKYRGMNTK